MAPLILIPALEADGWSASRPERFVPANKPSVPNEQEAERGIEPVWTHGEGGDSLAAVGNRITFP
jgi:hypothetical protein